MTVFKTFLKVLKSYKAPIILYTVLLVIFGGLTMQSNDTNTDFIAVKPKIVIINNDNSNSKVTKNLINYMKKNTKVVKLNNEKEELDDALFYRDINYVIYIPNNYGSNLLKGLNPEIKIKSADNYQSSYAEIILSRYVKTANIFVEKDISEEEFIKNIDKTLSKKVDVNVKSVVDTASITRATRYYNFLSYSILAGCIYVICLVLSSFKKDGVNKRSIISSTDYRKYNRHLLLSNCIFAFVLWVAYIIFSYILVGDVILTSHGFIYMLNSFIFTICTVTLAFLISNVVTNPTAISGVVNVVAVGSSFLCGAFVPMEFLPDSVLKVAHVLPSYWYIKNNELLKTIDEININSMNEILLNMGVIILFSILFVELNNVISKRKQKIS